MSCHKQSKAKKKARTSAPAQKGGLSRRELIKGGTALAAATLLAPLAGRARTPQRETSSLQRPRRGSQDPLLYRIFHNGEYDTFPKGESVSTLLSSMKRETGSHRISRNTYGVNLGAGTWVLIKFEPEDRDIFFQLGALHGNRQPSTGFHLSYRHLDIEDPQFRLKVTEKRVGVSLLDPATRRHVRIVFPKSGFSALGMTTSFFDETADTDRAMQAFAVLSAFPRFALERVPASRQLGNAFRKGEKFLERATSTLSMSFSDPLEYRFDRVLDALFPIYNSTADTIVDSFRRSMENMTPQQKEKFVAAALPRITALMLRIYVVDDSFRLLGELDRFISSPGFSGEALRSFAVDNRIEEVYKGTLKDMKGCIGSVS